MEDPVLSCSQIVHLPVEAVLVRVCPDVVVGAEAEGEVTLVVGSDVQHHGYYGPLGGNRKISTKICKNLLCL